jgi:hypothetical protein
MAPRFDEYSRLVAELSDGVRALDQVADRLSLAPLVHREWFELLQRKLLPQLGRDAYLIVAVVGGTNIGKSVVFNHIAGERVSATSPMASGTKHPTALIAGNLLDRVKLSDLFPGFTVKAWTDAEEPLQENERHLLFYRIGQRTPENLIILDTPDVDSVAQVNWERAAYLRQSADVLIAVLTQQKYNDAAVKEFFRKAAQEDKLVIIVFNQVLLPEDEQYWPLWLETFLRETGVHPHLIYLAPNDRRAAETNMLPFSERHWPSNPDGIPPEATSRNLLTELSELRFDEIKLQALSGALRHLVHPEMGVPAWLEEIRQRGAEFEEAGRLLLSNRLIEIENWPLLPNSVVIGEIREWWRRQRTGWTAHVHGFYNQLGKAISIPVRALRERAAGRPPDPIEAYREQEWQAILAVLQKCLERLAWLRDLNHPLLSPRVELILQGTARSELIHRLREEHERVDFEKELRELIEVQLRQFREETPQAYQLFRHLDSLAAASRPVVSIVLFMTGAGPIGDALIPVFADTVLQGALHVAGEAVGGTVVTAVGDKVITETASTGAGYLEARFRQIHATFAKRRAEWVAGQLEKLVFRELPEELSRAARIAECEPYRKVQSLTDQLNELLDAG